MLSWREEECSIYKRIPFEDVHHTVTENAGNSVHLIGGIVGEDEAASFVIANAALVFHLDVV